MWRSPTDLSCFPGVAVILREHVTPLCYIKEYRGHMFRLFSRFFCLLSAGLILTGAQPGFFVHAAAVSEQRSAAGDAQLYTESVSVGNRINIPGSSHSPIFSCVSSIRRLPTSRRTVLLPPEKPAPPIFFIIRRKDFSVCGSPSPHPRNLPEHREPGTYPRRILPSIRP